MFFEQKQRLTDSLEKITKNSFDFLQDNFEHMQKHIKTKITNIDEYKD